MTSSAALLSTALERYRQGNLTEAASHCVQILTADPTCADALHLLGLVAHQRGRADLAVDLITRAVAINPTAPAFHYNLANALKTTGDFVHAENSYRTATTLDPDNTDAWMNLGLLLEEQGRLKDAAGAYERATDVAPGSAKTFLALGKVLVKMGKEERGIKLLKKAARQAPADSTVVAALAEALVNAGCQEEARAIFQHALELGGESADLLFRLGNLCHQQKDYAGALEYFRRLIVLKPDEPAAFNNIGLTCSELGRAETARKSFLEAIRLNPEYVDPWFNLGNLEANQGNHPTAIRYFDRALALRPHHPGILHNRGSSFHKMEDFAAAEDSYRLALQVQPENADVKGNLAAVLVLQGKPEGICLFEEILAQSPDSADAHYQLGIAMLMSGNYERGWREYEWRWSRSKRTSPERNFTQPQWRGEAITGQTILLHGEQGLGDTLQFVRYAPLVVARGARVVLEVQPLLQRLLKNVPGIDACIANGNPLPGFDWQCPLMSLPLAFGTTIETIPPVCPLDRTTDGACGPQRESPLRVGLVWAGNPKHEFDAFRSISLSQYRPLAELRDVSFVSLQVGSAAEQAACWPGLPTPLATVTDFADTVAALDELDLVITIDSAVAHLAGTLKKPVWILQSSLPDWRWGLQGDATPWYPTARMFRRTSPGSWEDVIERVAFELRLLVEQRLH